VFLLAACGVKAPSNGTEYKKRVDSETASTFLPSAGAPITIKNNTPADLPRPVDQVQPPAPPVTPPSSDDGEETGSSTPLPGRPFGGGIGSNCGATTACGGEATACLSNGYPAGMCSKPCSRFCPDTSSSKTFCVADQSGGAGVCVAKCSVDSDCRAGYACRTKGRFMDSSVSAQKVCVPATEAQRSCKDTLSDIMPYGLPWDQPQQQWYNICDGSEHSCVVRDGVQVPNILNGTSFYAQNEASEYLNMSCQMAQTLFRVAYVAKPLAINSIYYQQIYHCDSTENFAATSEHGMGNAIDITAIAIGNTTYGQGSAQMNAFLDQLIKYHLFNNIYTQACNATLFGDHVHADLGLGLNPVRDLVADHFQKDSPSAPSCQWNADYCGN